MKTIYLLAIFAVMGFGTNFLEATPLEMGAGNAKILKQGYARKDMPTIRGVYQIEDARNACTIMKAWGDVEWKTCNTAMQKFYYQKQSQHYYEMDAEIQYNLTQHTVGRY